MPAQENITSTYIWMGIYLVSLITFFSIGAWVIVRGGKDVFEILKEAYQKDEKGCN